MSGVPPFAKRNEASSAPPSARNLVGLPVQNWTYSSRALWKLAFSPVCLCVSHTSYRCNDGLPWVAHTVVDVAIDGQQLHDSVSPMQEGISKVLFFFQFILFASFLWRHGGWRHASSLHASTKNLQRKSWKWS